MSKKDDLTEVKGIGPSNAKKLHAAKICSFKELAELSVAEINGIIGRKVASKDWIAQAKKLEASENTAKRKPSGKEKNANQGVDGRLEALFADIEKSKAPKHTGKPAMGQKHREKIESLDKHKALEKLGFLSWQLGIKKAEQVVEKMASKLFAKYDNITSIEVGEKIIGGQGTKIPAIRIMVEKKQPKDKLKPSELIPKTIEGIPTDIETCEVGKFRLAADEIIQGGEYFFRRGGSGGPGTVGIAAIIQVGQNKSRIGFITAAHVVRGGKKFTANDRVEMGQGHRLVGVSALTPGFFRENERGDISLVLAAPDIVPKSQVIGFTGLSFRAPTPLDEGTLIKKVGKHGKGTGRIVTVSCPPKALAQDNNNTVAFAMQHILIQKISGSFRKGDSGAAIIRDKSVIGFLRAINGNQVLATRFDFINASGLRPLAFLN